MSEIQQEEILKENPNRFTIFPIKYNDLWEFYQQHLACFWTSGDIDFEADREDWDNLNEDEKYFILNVLAFFAGSDGIVLENLMGNFALEVQVPEARAFYAVQGAIETIHSEVYSLLIETYGETTEQKDKLFRAIETMPAVSKKAEWALSYMNPENNSFAQRIVGFAVVEGIFFSGSFCAIFWFKSQNRLVKTLGTSNELISRDEALHCQFAICLYKHLSNKLSQDEIEEIVKPAVVIENEFICDSLKCRLVGMNADLMNQYIQFVADRLVVQLGYNTIYGVTNPFPFMENISLDGKTNFFEKRVTEYQLASSAIERSEDNIEIMNDF
tara:strand:- start:48 stop:1031 length:984 start_codon:yes stop_codon:yes gene_type:complete